MTTKTKFIASLAIVILGVSVVLKIKGINPAPLVGAGFIIEFLIFALFGMPDKHKNFTYSDQRKGMFLSIGGNAPPEIEEPKEVEIKE